MVPEFAALLLSPLVPAAPKAAVLLVKGDSSVIPKFINVCRHMGPEHGLDFRFVDKKEGEIASIEVRK